MYVCMEWSMDVLCRYFYFDAAAAGDEVRCVSASSRGPGAARLASRSPRLTLERCRWGSEFTAEQEEGEATSRPQAWISAMRTRWK